MEMKAAWDPSPRASSMSLDFSSMFVSPRRKPARGDGGEKEQYYFYPASVRILSIAKGGSVPPTWKPGEISVDCLGDQLSLNSSQVRDSREE